LSLTPEQQAREQIDSLLRAAGWLIQDPAGFNRKAAVTGELTREWREAHVGELELE
jgi:type I restriction enzyme, R subunit